MLKIRSSLKSQFPLGSLDQAAAPIASWHHTFATPNWPYGTELA